MDQIILSFGLDIVIAFLLGTTIVYAYLLNKRLQALRADREDMENLLRKFMESTEKANASIKTLKKTSADLGEELQSRIDKSIALRDEITFMLERGELLAKQIDDGISKSRVEKPGQDLTGLIQKAGQASDKNKKNKDIRSLESIFQDDAEHQSAAEKELLKALKGLR